MSTTPLTYYTCTQQSMGNSRGINTHAFLGPFASKTVLICRHGALIDQYRTLEVEISWLLSLVSHKKAIWYVANFRILRTIYLFSSSCSASNFKSFSRSLKHFFLTVCQNKIQTKLLGNNSRIVLFRRNQSVFECRWPADQIQDLKFGRTVYIRRKQCRSLDVNEVT